MCEIGIMEWNYGMSPSSVFPRIESMMETQHLPRTSVVYPHDRPSSPDRLLIVR